MANLQSDPLSAPMPQDPNTELTLDEARHLNDMNLKSRFEDIIARYERDFTGIGDIIDLETGDIVEDNGHIDKMMSEQDTGDGHNGHNIIAEYVEGLAESHGEGDLSPIESEEDASEEEDEEEREEVHHPIGTGSDRENDRDDAGSGQESAVEEADGSEDELASPSFLSPTRMVEGKEAIFTPAKTHLKTTSKSVSGVRPRIEGNRAVGNTNQPQGITAPVPQQGVPQLPNVAALEHLGHQISQNIAQFMQIWKGGNTSTTDPIWSAPPLPQLPRHQISVPQTPWLARQIQRATTNTPMLANRVPPQHAPFSESLWAQPGQRRRKTSADGDQSSYTANTKRPRQSKIFTPEEEALMLRLRDDCHMSWSEIVKHFPGKKETQLSARYYYRLAHIPPELDVGDSVTKPGSKTACPGDRSFNRGNTQPLPDRTKTTISTTLTAVPQSSPPRNLKRKRTGRDHPDGSSVMRTSSGLTSSRSQKSPEERVPISETPREDDIDIQSLHEESLGAEDAEAVEDLAEDIESGPESVGSSEVVVDDDDDDDDDDNDDGPAEDSASVAESDDANAAEDSGTEPNESIVVADVADSQDEEESYPDIMDSIESIEIPKPITPTAARMPHKQRYKALKTPSNQIQIQGLSSSVDPLSERPQSRYRTANMDASTSSWKKKKRHSLLSESDYYLSTPPTSRTAARKKMRAATSRFVVRAYTPDAVGSSEDELAV